MQASEQRESQLAILQILSDQRDKIRLHLPREDDDLSSQFGLGKSPSVSAVLSGNRRQFFESSLLRLLSSPFFEDPKVAFFPEDTVWELDRKLDRLLEMLDGAANLDFQPQASPSAGNDSGIGRHGYPRLYRMLLWAAASPGPFELATGSPSSLFSLESHIAARDANSLLREFNWFLDDLQQQAMRHVHRRTPQVTASPAGGSSDKPGRIRELECDFRDHIGSVLDAISKGFRACEEMASDVSHRMLIRLLDLGSLEESITDTHLEMLLYCGKLENWQRTTCRSAGHRQGSADLDGCQTPLCEHLESAWRYDDSLLLDFHRALDAFARANDQETLCTTTAVADPQQFPVLADLIHHHGAFDIQPQKGQRSKLFRFPERRALAVQLAWNLLLCCGWHHVSKPWDAHQVLFHGSSAEQYEKERPYIVCLVGPNAPASDVPTVAVAEPIRQRPMPSLTLFAKVLLELEYGPLPSGDFSAKNDYGYKLVKSFYESKKEFGDLSREAYLKAVETCLQFDKLHGRQRGMSRARHETDTETRRSLIRTHIVANLMQDLQNISQPSRKRPRRQVTLEDDDQVTEAFHMPMPEQNAQLDKLDIAETRHRKKSRRVRFSSGDDESKAIERFWLDQPLRFAPKPLSDDMALISTTHEYCGYMTLQRPHLSPAPSEAGASHLPPRPDSREGFTIAFICALPLEADAIKALFDCRWDTPDHAPYGRAPGDHNAYSIGVIGKHPAVVVHMPGMGKINSTMVAIHCRMSFPNIKLAIVVGICGAVPFPKGGDVEIVLGDVIVSDSVVQYDLRRQLPNRFLRKDTLQESLGRPNLEIRTVLAKLRNIDEQEQLEIQMARHLRTIQQNQRLKAGYPGAEHDHLFDPRRHHDDDTNRRCATCDCCLEPPPLLPAPPEQPESHQTQCSTPIAQEAGPSSDPAYYSNEALCPDCGCKGPLIRRKRLASGQVVLPAVHIGPIASGDTVMKSGRDRDDIAAREGVLGFEMEGAGVWDVFPCVVIKGVCDYADSHKSKSWQRYAAATAAACAKAFLDHWVPRWTAGVERSVSFS